ncbi:MAG: AmmeMemoRadiSam system radical SAM enzyme [Deltaproteobacteria bacterium]|nr:AmmeMemoRadiSam system radical SAM enzyme [Deltaproteobacteria bacterium]
MAEAKVQAKLARYSAPMTLAQDEGRGRFRCLACAHRCLVPEGHAGVCKVRFTQGGRLMGPWGYVSGLQDDPVEKKPFFHAFPGARALSFGMLGCDFHCSFCQNWYTSQTLRDEASGAPLTPLSPESIVQLAVDRGARLLTSTYNEPLITTEWAAAVFRVGQARGLTCSFVSNGYNTEEALDHLSPMLALCNVDLKSFDDRAYRRLGGTLAGVQQGIERLHRRGLWVEVVTLVVPGMNDGEDELRAMAGFIAEISRDIPWHITAFHPEYRELETPATPVASLLRAAQIGQKAGLRYVYLGNLPGQAPEHENTRCPHCQTLLVARRGYSIRAYYLRGGACPTCGAPIPGRWAAVEDAHKDVGTTGGVYALNLRGS